MAYGQAIAALADPTRRTVLERLRKGPQPAGALARGLDVSRPAVSQHLRVLEDAGLVSARREGTRRIYQVELQGLAEVRRYLDTFWTDVLEAFRAEAERPAKPHPRARTRRKPRRSHGTR